MVEDLLKLDFKIACVITKNISIPIHEEKLEKLFPGRSYETKKIALLDENFAYEKTSKNISKMQLAVNANKKVVILYDFFKGLDEREKRYFKILFKKMSMEYGKKIILVSNNLDNVIELCDLFVIYDKKIIYKTNNIFEDKLYKYVDMPKIVRFIKLANKKKAVLPETVVFNDLLKDIYRRINEDKNNI